MIIAVFNQRLQWSLDFGPDSVIMTVKNLVQEMTRSSQENPLPAWNFLLLHKQVFLDSYLAQTPISPKQQGTFEMKEEVLANAGAQNMDNSRSELSDLKDIEFFWETHQMGLDAPVRPGIDTHFSPTAFNDIKMRERGSSDNSIVLDEKEDKENFLLTIAVSKRPTEPSKLLRNLFERWSEDMSDFVYRTLFE